MIKAGVAAVDMGKEEMMATVIRGVERNVNGVRGLSAAMTVIREVEDMRKKEMTGIGDMGISGLARLNGESRSGGITETSAAEAADMAREGMIAVKKKDLVISGPARLNGESRSGGNGKATVLLIAGAVKPGMGAAVKARAEAINPGKRRAAGAVTAGTESPMERSGRKI
jgi:hypothetical protein